MTDNDNVRSTPNDTSNASRSRVPVGRVAAVAVCLAITVLWAMAFAGWGKSKPADWLEDRQFVAQAIEICTKYEARIAQLPDASLSATPEQRARVVGQANGDLQSMIDALAKLNVSSEPELKTVRLWIDDYRTHLNDRREWEQRLANGDGNPFVETPRDKIAISKIVDGFAAANRMEQCQTPADV